MRCDEIITEAPLSPGQVKAIKVKIEGYQDEIRKLNRQKLQLDDRFKYQEFPDPVAGPLTSWYSNAPEATR